MSFLVLQPKIGRRHAIASSTMALLGTALMSAPPR